MFDRSISKQLRQSSEKPFNTVTLNGEGMNSIKKINNQICTLQKNSRSNQHQNCRFVSQSVPNLRQMP
jgi:hypothetical protein